MANVDIQGIYHCYDSNSFELVIEHLEVNDGQTVALIGESGCGKTTLLRAIAGLECPSKGVIKIGETEVCSLTTFLPPEKRNVGLVFQDYALFPHLTVRNNIEFGIRQLASEEKKKRFQNILEITNLQEFIDRYPHELSGGQQQRVAIARALVCQPKVLLLDEPFSNMDEPLKVKLRSEIKELIDSTNTTTVLVSHDIRDAFAIADSIVILKEGKIEQVGSAEEIRRSPNNEYVKRLVNIT